MPKETGRVGSEGIDLFREEGGREERCCCCGAQVPMGWEQLLNIRCCHPKPFLAHSRMSAEHPLCKAPTARLGTPHLAQLGLVPTAAELVDRALLGRARGKLKIIIII